MKIAILGGTGKEGSGLGYRWAAAGHEIIIGSRTAEKGESAAEEMQSELPLATISGMDNASAAADAELVVLSVPYDAQEKTLADVHDAVQGKLLITVVAPLGQPKARVWHLPSGLSAAEEAQQQLVERVQQQAADVVVGLDVGDVGQGGEGEVGGQELVPSDQWTVSSDQ